MLIIFKGYKMNIAIDKKITIKTCILHILYDSSSPGERQCKVSLSGVKNVSMVCNTENLLEVYHVLHKFFKEIKT